MAALITLTNATLGTDVERGETQTGTPTAKFRCVVNKRRPNGTETATWFSVECYGAQARGVATLEDRGHIGKGKRVNVTGEVEAREYTDRSGNQRTSLDVTATLVEPIWGQQDDATQAPRPGVDHPYGRPDDINGPVPF
jgi:single-strand DNA-binding protein